jgi:hypothetical protein
MSFASVYPLYIKKGDRKGRTKEEVDINICWLTRYRQQALQQQIDRNIGFETFFSSGQPESIQMFRKLQV